MFSKIKKAFKEYQDLKFLAYHDPLTGLLNRNWLLKNAKDLAHEYVYFIDLNDVNKINKDGHTVGDLYIKMMVDSIKLRLTLVQFILRDDKMDEDILVRYGGDEFVLFSCREKAITTNKYYSVGVCKVSNGVMEAISLADRDMVKSKEEFKKTEEKGNENVLEQEKGSSS